MSHKIRDPLLNVLVFLLLSIPGPLFAIPARGADDDPFDDAVPITYSTQLKNGTLHSSEMYDAYLIKGLIGDTDNDQKSSQRFQMSLQRTSGADIEARIFEPNRREIAYLRSSDDWSEVEFVVPYDGDYYFILNTDPPGGDAEYDFVMGGEYDYDNSPYSGNNIPGEATFERSRKLSLTLNPVGDIVDYYTIDLQPGWALESRFNSQYSLRLEVLDSDFDLIGHSTDQEPVEFRNDALTSKIIHTRMSHPLDGRNDYQPVNRPYELHLEVWAFMSRPEVRESDPQWSDPIRIDEDPENPIVLNLSYHFFEANDDPLQFRITSEHAGLMVSLINVTTSYGDPLYTLLEIMPKENWFGEETVVLLAWDRDGSVTDSIRMIVDPVNDPPYVSRIGGAAYSGGTFHMGVNEGERRIYTMDYNDVDDPLDELVFTIDEPLGFVDIDPDNGTMTVTPSQKDVGVHYFNITVRDPSGGVLTIPTILTIVAINDPPLKPSINVVSGNVTNLFPGEMIVLEAVSPPDPDGDELTFMWDWGDGTKSEGPIASHVYAEGVYGNRTVKLISSDGSLTNFTTITVHISSPQDISVGDLRRTNSDVQGDCIEFREEWREGEDNRRFSIIRSSYPGVDILSVSTVRRLNDVQVTLHIRGSIEMDGEFRYHVLILDKGTEIPHLNISLVGGWDMIPDRMPASSIIARQSYLGALHENTTGTIMDQDRLVFNFPILFLNMSGLPLPLDRDDMMVVAVTELIRGERTTGRLNNRIEVFDMAGDDVPDAPNVTTSNATGGGSSPLANIPRATGIAIFAGLMILLGISGAVGYILLKREKKKRKEEEERFISEVERMRGEGRNLFDRVKEGKTPQVSYEELYGSPPQGKKNVADMPSSESPGPVLDSVDMGDFTVGMGPLSGKISWEE
ncbi:MAG: PKD domain-containing protein [Candidatus Thermoplasmatota archaeon]|nr:PKD domain-containing protein [Candidatus Thermoplasmatota archaeon]